MREKEDMSMERCGDGQKHRYPVDQVEEAILMQMSDESIKVIVGN